ncbi:uncharacterized protein LOC144139220 [Haemaphysalis longicornis]
MQRQFVTLFVAASVSICSGVTANNLFQQREPSRHFKSTDTPYGVGIQHKEGRRAVHTSANDATFFRNTSRVEGPPDSGLLGSIVSSYLLSTDLALMTLEDIKRVAKVKLEPQARRYFFTGAEKEQTLKENTAAFQRLRFRPRYLVDVSKVTMSTTILGHRISFPVGFSPFALHKMAHPDGEGGTARAVRDAGTVMILSSFSSTAMEEVRRQAPDALLFFQTYMFRKRSVTKWLVQRAAKAGYSAIVLTADSPVVGHKISPARNRFTLPRNVTFANLIGAPGALNLTAAESKVNEFISPSVSWKDVAWLRQISGLPVVVKGILTAEAAVQAANHGAAAVLVSNHGGRQLDGTPATIEVLPEIVSAVGHRLEVYLDSGVRSGSDVAKALSFGARAVFCGRPGAWGLSYDGKKGVDKVLDILRTELERTLKLLGCQSVQSLNPGYVVHKSHYAKPYWHNFGHMAL